MGCLCNKQKNIKESEKPIPIQKEQTLTINTPINNQFQKTQSINPNQIDIKYEPIIDNNVIQEASQFKQNIINQFEENKNLISKYEQQIQIIQNDYQQNLNSYPQEAKLEFQQFQTNEEQKQSYLQLQKLIIKEQQQYVQSSFLLDKITNKMQNIQDQPKQFKDTDLFQLQQKPESTEKIIKNVSKQQEQINNLFQEYNELFGNIKERKRKDEQELEKYKRFLNDIAQKLVQVDEAVKKLDEEEKKRQEDEEKKRQDEEEKKRQDEEEKKRQDEEEKKRQDEEANKRKKEEIWLAIQFQNIGKYYANKFTEIQEQMQNLEKQMVLVDKKLESIQ